MAQVKVKREVETPVENPIVGVELILSEAEATKLVNLLDATNDLARELEDIRLELIWGFERVGVEV